MSHFDEYYEQQQSEIWESVTKPIYAVSYNNLLVELKKAIDNNEGDAVKAVQALEDSIFHQLKYRESSWSIACHILAREVSLIMPAYKQGSEEFNYLKKTLNYIELMKNNIPNDQRRKFFVYLFNEEDIMQYFEQINDTSEKLHFIKELRVGLNSFYKNTDSYANEIKSMREFILTLEKKTIAAYNQQNALLYFQLKIEYKEIEDYITDLFDRLKHGRINKDNTEGGFIAPETSIIQFKKLFFERNSTEFTPVLWTGSKPELNLFIKTLVDKKKINKQNHWIVAITVFRMDNVKVWTNISLATANDYSKISPTNKARIKNILN